MNNPVVTTPPESKRILVVDDEAIILAALRETLRLEDYEVSAFENPLEALPVIQTTPFSVILTDQQMPGMSGLEFLNRAKELQPNATRILITGVVNLGTVVEAINQGEVYRFIIKPWLREELLVTVRNAVHRYELIVRNDALQAQTAAMNDQLKGQLEQLNEQNHRLDNLLETLRENLDRSVQLCLKLIETYSPSLGQQARRVSGLCQAMAESLNLAPEHRQVLEISSRLYDIGLVGVPREVIRKWQQTPSALGPDARALVELHPVLGQELVSFVAGLGAVGETIRAHHERFDGTGYPDKLSADQIPWLARLLAVAVAYAEASDEKARDYIAANQGSAFDPEAVRIFLRCLPKAEVSRPQREVLIAELQAGMVVAQGIYTSNGMLLIPEGHKLSEPQIQFLRNHHRISPITQALLVYG
jgi:response regulator RpfG family c-di-GMP phosphodiesterase